MNTGRVAVSAQTLPVLTGTPVAGMAYLDRPKPAGYFIFPDLSVRHEGKYRLSFNLYEELKEPEKDADVDSPEPSPRILDKTTNKGSGCKDVVHFRLEVKSGPFSVFSAKKFPGLSESTQLSRTVNDQGCRVRIRRDVRMRRRDKTSDGYQNNGDDSGYHHPDRFATAHHPPDRPRSISNASAEASTPYSIERRGSLHDVDYYHGAGYQQPPPPPRQSATSYASHLSFGGPSTPHYQTPVMNVPPPPPLQQAYPQPPQVYGHGPPIHARQISAPHNYTYPCQPPQQATYVPPPYIDEKPFHDVRHSSGDALSARQQMPSDSYVQHHPALQAHSASSLMRSLTPLNTNTANQAQPSLPPIKSLVQTSDMESPSSEPKSSMTGGPHGPQNPYSANSHLPAGCPSYTSGTPQSSHARSTSQGKRMFESAFDGSHVNQPLHGGKRPSEALAAQDTLHVQTDDGEYIAEYDDLNGGSLGYRRADGTIQYKKCPSPRDQRYITFHKPYDLNHLHLTTTARDTRYISNM